MPRNVPGRRPRPESVGTLFPTRLDANSQARVTPPSSLNRFKLSVGGQGRQPFCFEGINQYKHRFSAEVLDRAPNRRCWKSISCHSEARFSPKNLSVDLAYIQERFFASLRMTSVRLFSTAPLAAEATFGRRAVLSLPVGSTTGGSTIVSEAQAAAAIPACVREAAAARRLLLPRRPRRTIRSAFAPRTIPLRP